MNAVTHSRIPTSAVVAAGPITKQPGTLPYRIVLRRVNDQWVVWTESWDHLETAEIPLENGIVLGQPMTGNFSNGQYFTHNQFMEALDCFIERLAEDAHNHYASMNRAA